MKKIKNKLWLDKHSIRKHLKALRRKKRKNRKGYTNSKGISDRLRSNLNKGKQITVPAPSNFSFINNPNETLDFFNFLSRQINKGMPIFFDMSKIENLTIDAIMYFLAIVKNYRNRQSSDYHFTGNYPENKECKILLESSGFLQYVESNKLRIETHSNLIKIKNGKIADPEIAKNICDLVINQFDLQIKDTHQLYDIVMELMLNAKQHAYVENKKLLNEWYIFVRTLSENNKIEFIFLDTGLGIPTTIKKTKFEQAQKWFNKFKINIANFKEWQLIQSALDGAYRSRIGSTFRGKGLPKVQSIRNDKFIKNLTIISNFGFLSDTKNIDTERAFRGTLFYWELDKEYFNENDKNCS